MSSDPVPPSSAPIQLILIEDQSLIADGIVAVLRQLPHVRVLRVFESATAALNDEVALRAADLALVDFHLGKKEEEARLRELRRRHPGLRCIWLSGAVSTASLLQIESIRFHGFVHKDDPAQHLLSAVQAVMSGRAYHSPTARELLHRLSDASVSVPKVLSEREQEVLALIGAGLGNDEMAARLGLSASTVQTHRRNIMGKLGLRTSVALQAYALRGGFAADEQSCRP